MNIRNKPFDDLIRDWSRQVSGRGLHVVNADDGLAEVRIYDIIGWPFIEAQDVAAQLDQITADEIVVAINSPGGDVFEAIAIYNLLRLHSARVTTRVDGLAASAASVVAQAGDHRVMVTAGQMMIHRAWGITLGDSDIHRKAAEILDQQDEVIAGIYAARSGRDASEFTEMMTAETWFTDDTAVDAGLADEVVEPPRKPKDQAPKRFTDHLQAVLTATEEVITETENVITFRSTQGKPPLSDDAVALVEALTAATDRLAAFAAEPEQETPDELEAEYLRFLEMELTP